MTNDKSNSPQIPLNAAVGVSADGRVRIRESAAPGRSVVRGECMCNYPLLTGAQSEVIVPRNNGVSFWQSTLLRDMNRINVRLCVC